MKNIYVSSDLHLNLNLPLRSCIFDIGLFARKIGGELLRLEADIYIINGDISWDVSEIEYFLNTLKNRLQNKCQVYVVMGNHDLSKNYTINEFLYGDLFENYLPKSPIELEDKVIFGLNGFSDLSYQENNFSEDYTEQTLATLNKRYFKKDKNFDIKTVDKIIDTQIAQLEKQIQKFDADKERILVTHYIPKKEYLLKATNEKSEAKNIFMGSSKVGEFLEEHQFSRCYFGHTHRRLTENETNLHLNGVEYFCNPLGTHRESLKWGYIPKNTEKSLGLYFEQWKKTLIKI